MNEEEEFSIDLPDSEDSSGSHPAGPTPQKSGMKKITLLVIAILILLMIFVVAVSRCSVTKKTDNPSASVSASTSVDGESKAKPKASTPGPIAHEVPDQKAVASDNGGAEATPATKQITKVNPDSVSGDFSAQGFVLDKYAYVQNGQYQYVIDISLTHGKGKSVNVKYLTTRSGYDNVDVGNILNITYGADDQGNISITNISRP